jgi:hypothetical protein
MEGAGGGGFSFASCNSQDGPLIKPEKKGNIGFYLSGQFKKRIIRRNGGVFNDQVGLGEVFFPMLSQNEVDGPLFQGLQGRCQDLGGP